MRIIIETSDSQGRSTAAVGHPVISVDSTTQLETTGGTALSGGGAPGYGGVIGSIASGETLDALSGGTAEVSNAPSSLVSSSMELDGGAAPAK